MKYFQAPRGTTRILDTRASLRTLVRHPGPLRTMGTFEPRSLFDVLLKIKLCEYKFDASSEWYPARSKRPRPLIVATVLKKV